jgi:amidase
MIGKSLLGLTLACTHCHDHEFDPIPQKDYYSVAGILASTQTLKGIMTDVFSDLNRVRLPETPAEAAQTERDTANASDKSNAMKGRFHGETRPNCLPPKLMESVGFVTRADRFRRKLDVGRGASVIIRQYRSLQVSVERLSEASGPAKSLLAESGQIIEMRMTRLLTSRLLILATLTPLVQGGLCAQLKSTAATENKSFNVVEATIPEMLDALEHGRVTSRELVLQYLSRIGLYEDKLHCIITVNPAVLQQATERDRERSQGRVRGPLHGIPIALKDNILTHDIVTTGGALAFDGYLPPYDATLVKNLRDSGAIIIAKTGLTELANWIAGGPTPMPGNYNAIRGFGYNPYDPRRDPRDTMNDGRPVLPTGGSSSGVGTAANFWAGNVGSETSGSILSPSNQNMLVGIKPTVGRISRYGVIPITADQDTAGPMAKTVVDAAILLGALESAAPDSNDAATKTCTPPPGRDYTKFLKPDGLKGARIGIPRIYFYDRIIPPRGRGATPNPGTAAARDEGLNPEQSRVMTEAIEILKQQGAIIVDPADIPSISTADSEKNFLSWNPCSGSNGAKGKDADCSVVLKYGMKRDFNAWLATLGLSAPVKTLTELRLWNITHTAAGALRYGQSNLDISDEMDVNADRARYEVDRATDIDLAGKHGIDEVMKAHKLDALLFPGASGAAIAAKPGYPTVIVPFGMTPNAPTPPLPARFDAKPAPFGVSFTGMACSEPRLLEIAFSFEQATKRRVPPASTP